MSSINWKFFFTSLLPLNRSFAALPPLRFLLFSPLTDYVRLCCRFCFFYASCILISFIVFFSSPLTDFVRFCRRFCFFLCFLHFKFYYNFIDNCLTLHALLYHSYFVSVRLILYSWSYIYIYIYMCVWYSFFFLKKISMVLVKSLFFSHISILRYNLILDSLNY